MKSEFLLRFNFDDDIEKAKQHFIIISSIIMVIKMSQQDPLTTFRVGLYAGIFLVLVLVAITAGHLFLFYGIFIVPFLLLVMFLILILLLIIIINFFRLHYITNTPL